jgi:alkyldihydroxyacetonephosphate synthase
MYDGTFLILYLVSQSKVWPASIRLVDNQQFIFGMSLKT